MGDGLAEWIITTPDGAQLLLQMAYFDRGRQPVLMEFGPVLDLDDVLGGKVAALASRAAERDYLDVAAALARGYTVARLTALALTLDPGLTAEDFAGAGQRLDHLDDDRFTPYGLSSDDVTRLRKQFAAWPRTPGAVPDVPPTGAPFLQGPSKLPEIVVHTAGNRPARLNRPNRSVIQPSGTGSAVGHQEPVRSAPARSHW